MLPDVLAGMVVPLEQTRLGLKRCTGRDKQYIQHGCGERLAQCLHSTDVTRACSDIDKIFCSSWLDHNNVLVGTKCNKLRQLHVPSRTWQDVPYPEQPVHRQGPDLLASINRSHCGQHGLAVSPSGAYCVTGGTAAEDILLWRLQDGSGPSNRAGMQPVQTFMGHADWVFDVDWLSDRHWVSGSRDGTIKLWQVPEAAAGSSYSTDPGSALLSVGFHGGKVRAISFDQQQQQVVALATDCSLSWWSPDLMLRGSARMGVQEPVALAVNGPVVAIGGDGTVLLLDIREPCGTKRSHSSSGESPTHKRSRLHDGAGSSRQPHAFGPPDAAAAAEGAAADAGVLSGWLPPAYPWLRLTAARPMVLAVTGSLPGMQGLQNTSAAAGMDPVLAELVLRQEAASLAVARGLPFDTVLQDLVNRLLQLRPSQQLQELSQLQHKFMPEHSSAPLQQQQVPVGPPPAGPQAAQQQLQSSMAGALMQAELQVSMLGGAIRQPQVNQLQQLQAVQQHVGQDASDGARAAAAAGAGSAAPAAAAAAAAAAGSTAAAAAGSAAPGAEPEAGEESEYSDDYYSDDQDEEPDEVLGPEAQAHLLSLLLPGFGQHPAADGMQGPAVLQQLPNAVRYALERSRSYPWLAMQQQQQQQQQPQPQQQQCPQGDLVQARELQARLQGSLVTFGTVVRSVSIHNDVILGVGHNSMDFHDLRRIRSDRSLNVADASDSSLLTRFEVPASRSVLNPVLLQHGLLLPEALTNRQPAVYTHCWDPSGTHVLAAGGPLALSLRGASMQLLT